MELLILAKIRVTRKEVIGKLSQVRHDIIMIGEAHGAYACSLQALQDVKAAAPQFAREAAPPEAKPPTPRKVVSVTRDDDPAHTRETVVASPPVDRMTPVGEPVDRDSAGEMTRVFTPSDRPASLPGKEPLAFPDLTGSQDETPPRGTGVTPTQVSPGPKKK